jgi:hypothetical protein
MSGAVVMEKEGATYQEQHELGRHDTLHPKSSRFRVPSRGFRPVYFCSRSIFEGNWILCRVVTSINKRNSSRRIDNGGLSEEVISEQVKTLDSAILEGSVREVGFETRRYDEAEMGACRKVRIWEGMEANGGGRVWQDSPVCIC